MAKVRQMVNGVPKTVELPLTYYVATVPVTTAIGVGGTGYDSTHTIFTLPNSETYDGTDNELQVFVNDGLAEEGVDYNYDASTTATTITFTYAIPQNARVIFIKTTL